MTCGPGQKPARVYVGLILWRWKSYSLTGIIFINKLHLIIDKYSKTSMSCGMLCCVIGVTVPDISKNCSDFTFRVKQSQNIFHLRLLDTEHESTTILQNIQNYNEVTTQKTNFYLQQYHCKNLKSWTNSAIVCHTLTVKRCWEYSRYQNNCT